MIEILEAKNTVQEVPKAKELNTLSKGIVFDHVHFSYSERTVLDNFSLEIKKGELVALVGQSGSGKTTIANLLNRFYDIQKGTLSLDGIPIQELRFNSLYGLLGVVTQEALLFNDTVGNNLRIGKQNATDTELMTAAKAANAHEFIEQMEQGYNTPIGEGGNKLSGGQKQRLSIARAILKNPDILILDEATNALDIRTENEILNGISNLKGELTIIIISHDENSLKICDKIL